VSSQKDDSVTYSVSATCSVLVDESDRMCEISDVVFRECIAATRRDEGDDSLVSSMSGTV
jgi:hypothetical protein